MSNAARRVLELFLQPPKRGVAGVTDVTSPFATPENPTVTPVTSGTYQKQHSPDKDVIDVTPAPWTQAQTSVSEASIVQWLDLHPAPSIPGRCAWCGQHETVSAAVVPFGIDPRAHAWLHSECWRSWQTARRAAAVKDLKRIGILTDVSPRGRP